MNEAKAIEILKLHQEPTEWDLYNDDVEAIKLAINDMSYVQTLKKFPHLINELPFPGETP